MSIVECVGLAAQAPKRSLVVDQIGANELGHRDREEALVPDQVNLVAIAAADRLEHGPARGDFVPLRELP